MSIEQLKGKVLSKIDGAHGASDEIRFFTTDGEEFVMYHVQDCCESVSVEDICGDIADLMGEPILEASEESEAGPDVDRYDGGSTWTFYKLGTRKGSVTIRWLGSSNGYYSERVDFEQVKRFT